MIINDYYEVRVPMDLEESSGEMEKLAEHAIDEARERAKLWCIPADHSTAFLREEWAPEYGATAAVFRVRRRRNKVG